MLIIRVILVLTAIVAVLLSISQVILPLLTGKPVFGIFRRRTKIRAAMIDEAERIREASDLAELHRLRAQAEDKLKKSEEPQKDDAPPEPRKASRGSRTI